MLQKSESTDALLQGLGSCWEAVKQGWRFPEKGSLVEVKRAQAPSRQIVKELGTLNFVWMLKPEKFKP